MKLIATLFCVLFLFQKALPQKTSDASNIKGTAYIAGDVSPNQARIQAINDAKVNALKAAGIVESINSYQLLFTSQVKNDYTQFFSSDIQSEMQGAVKSMKVLNEKMYCKNDKEIIYEVLIDAVIVKYEARPDPAFKANIEGIKGVYNNGDNLSFSVVNSQNCYLTIFNITDTEAGVLFPNRYETKNHLTKAERYHFPMAKIDYSLGNEQKKQETNRLIFVFTKKEVPFIKMDMNQVTTNENIFNWIYSISPDERNVEYFGLTILK